METAQAGDKCDFTGALIVVPDVGQMAMPGAAAESGARHKAGAGYESEGVRGLKALGVRDLSYRLAFLACTVTPSNARVSSRPSLVQIGFLVFSGLVTLFKTKPFAVSSN